MRIDLHTHSTASDGTDSPAELVRNAAAAGLDVVALTDQTRPHLRRRGLRPCCGRVACGGHRGPAQLRPRRGGADRGLHRQGPHDLRGQQLLRVYWYDGARRRIHTPEQQAIAELPDVKVRLGNLNANNQQKGVDSLIRTDLESLARHRAISDAALVGGDEDLVSAVEAAQGYGARVHLWGIEAAEGRNQAEALLWEVDSQRTFELDFCRPYVTRRPVTTYENEGEPPPSREEVRFVGAQIAAAWLAERGRDRLAELLPGAPYLPGAVDQDLLVEAERLLSRSLRGHASLRRALRDGFWQHLKAQY
ncbi:hypothetical protein STANM309S_02511 [Streptomyces tanashiensis]